MMAKYTAKDLSNLLMGVLIRAVFIKEKCMEEGNYYSLTNRNILENLKQTVYRAEGFMRPILLFQDGYSIILIFLVSF